MTPEQVAVVVDELGALDKELAPFRTKITREEKLRKMLREGARGANPLAEVHGEGKVFRIVLGPCGMKRVVVSKAKLIKALTAKVWRQIVPNPTFEQIDARLSPVEQLGITAWEQTGTRALNVYEKVAEKAA